MNQKMRWFAIILYWGSYATFQLNSIPHIAWVFHEYDEKIVTDLKGALSWVFAYAAAMAIDIAIGWLGHVIALSSLRTRWYEKLLYVGFLLALASVSWYCNWVFEIAHSPTADATFDVWSVKLSMNVANLSGLTVGTLTPLLCSAMCIFVLSYTSILGKINQMAARQAKSVEELVKELDDTKERTRLEREIKQAQKSKVSEEKPKFIAFANVGKEMIGAVRAIGSELSADHVSSDHKKLEKLVELFNGAPSLLEQEEEAFAAIDAALHLHGNEALIRFWRLKAKDALERQEQVLAIQEPKVVNSYIESYVPVEKATLQLVEDPAIYVPPLADEPPAKRGRPVGRRRGGVSA